MLSSLTSASALLALLLQSVASNPLRLPIGQVGDVLSSISGANAVVTAVQPQLTSLGFVFSTFAPTATPSVLTTQTHVDVSISTPTPTVIINPTDLSLVTTTLGEAEGTVTATSTIVEAGPTVTPIPPPAPIVSLCSPYFYLGNATLFWLRERSVTAQTPFFSQIRCTAANITSKELAKAVGNELCENVFVTDGLLHSSPNFVPYQCPILSPNGIVKQPRGCNGTATFDTLCALKL